MEVEKNKKLGLNSTVIIWLVVIFLTSIIFIGFISTKTIVKLGNISISVAEKDITSEYVNYIMALMDRKAKEYSHVFELGVNLANVYATQAAFICENSSEFKFEDKALSEYRDTFIKDEKRGVYISHSKGILDILCDTNSRISNDDIKLYYSLSFLNPLIEVILSNSKYFENFNLMLFSRYYEIFSTKSNAFNVSMISSAASLKEYMDSIYSEFLSDSGTTLEVDYRFKSMVATNAITCSAKYFDKTTGKPKLSGTVGINLENLTKDMEKEEIQIIKHWKGLELSEFAKKYVFTFVFETDTSEFVILQKDSLDILGFNAISLMASDQKDGSNIFAHLRAYAFDSNIPDLRILGSKVSNSNSGQFHINLNSMDYVFIYHKMTYGNWVLFTAIPYSIFLEPAIEARKIMRDVIYDFNANFILVSILFFGCAGLIIAFLFRRYIVIPIRGFSERALKMSKGNFGVTVMAKGGREIHDLGISFNLLSGELRTYMKNLEVEMESQSKVESEMDIARKIQQSLLPRWDLFLKDNRFSLFCELIPAKEVAGDFYDLMMLDENRLMFLVADVSGKGISAAFFMSIAKNVIRNACVNEPDNPAVAMRTANEIMSQYGTEMFVTVFLCYVDLNSGKLNYANAGHNEALLLTPDGGFRYFGKLGNAVAGFIPGLDFALGEDVINPGETMILYTDGITEATSPSEELFEEERLSEIAVANHDCELKEICSEIIHAVEIFDNCIQFDDITVLAFRRK